MHSHHQPNTTPQSNQLTYYTTINTSQYTATSNDHNASSHSQSNIVIDIFQLTQNPIPSARVYLEKNYPAAAAQSISFLPQTINANHPSATNNLNTSATIISNLNRSKQSYKEMLKGLKKGITVNAQDLNLVLVDSSSTKVPPTSAVPIRGLKKSQTLLNIKGDRIENQHNVHMPSAAVYTRTTAPPIRTTEKLKSKNSMVARRERTFDLEINLEDKMTSQLFDSTNQSIRSNISTPRYQSPIRARIRSEKKNPTPELNVSTYL